jgi:hypothetical protein
MPNKTSKRGAAANRRFARRGGYTATEAQLAEIMLFACALRHSATDMHNTADRLCRIADKIDLLRATIRGEAV